MPPAMISASVVDGNVSSSGSAMTTPLQPMAR